MSEQYEYAALRVVPRADREESMNGGVLLYCRAHKFLAAGIDLDARRLHALDPAATSAGSPRPAARSCVRAPSTPASPTTRRRNWTGC